MVARNSVSWGSTLRMVYAVASVHAPYGGSAQYGMGVVPGGGQK